MIYGFEMMYQILDKHVENNMSEIEHAFVSGMKWPDSYILEKQKDEFWNELQETYDILFTESERGNCLTVGELKRKIKYKGE